MALARPRPLVTVVGTALALMAGTLAAPATSAQVLPGPPAAGEVAAIGGSPGVGPARSLAPYVEGIAVRNGVLYLPSDGVVRRVDLLTGDTTALAGDGTTAGYGRVSDKVIQTGRSAAVDGAGNVYVAERGVPGRVVRVDSGGGTTVVAGDGIARTGEDSGEDWGDGGAGPDVPLSYADGIAVAPDGTVYVAQANYHRVRRIEPSGRVSTVAGTGVPGFSGDGGRGVDAQLTWPRGLAVDALGALYIADSSNQRIRRVDPSGVITTVVGGGSTAVDEPSGRTSSSCAGQTRGRLGGFAGDGGPAVLAQLACPAGIAVAEDGTLYVSDTANHRVRKISLDGRITTYAGNGEGRYGPDSGPATGTPLYVPLGIAVDRGIVYTTHGNVNVRRITPTGQMDTVAGRAYPFQPQEGVSATSTEMRPRDTVAAPEGGTYVAERAHVRHIDRDGVVRTVAGKGFWQTAAPIPSADGVPAREAWIETDAVDVDDTGALLVAGQNTGVLRLDPATGRFRLLVGGGSAPAPDDGPARGTQFYASNVSAGPSGSVYVSQDARVWRVDPDGSMHRVLGVEGGDDTQAEQGRPGRETPITDVVDLARTPEGDLLVATRPAVWRLAADGTATVVAGQIFRGFNGNEYDDDVATSAELGTASVVAGPEGVLYVADRHRIRKVTPDGAIRTVAGAKLDGHRGDGGPALQARFTDVDGLSLSEDGDLVVADTWNERVRRISGVADAPSTPESRAAPELTVTVEPDAVEERTERIDARDPARPPAHPGVVKVTARASSPLGVRQLQLRSFVAGASGSSRAAARDVLDIYVAQPGTHTFQVTATDGEGNTTEQEVSFSIASAAEASAPACAGAPEDGFADVSADSVHESSIDCATWWKVTRGAAAGGYAPGGQVTRAQMASFLARVLESADRREPATRDHYVDDEDSPHEAAINDLADAGILSGTGPATYSPDRPVTRGQLATMVARTYELALGSSSAATASFFLDDSFDVHRGAIDRAAESALLTGTTSGRYAPGQLVTRAQLASMLSRVLARLAERGLVTRPV